MTEEICEICRKGMSDFGGFRDYNRVRREPVIYTSGLFGQHAGTPHSHLQLGHRAHDGLRNFCTARGGWFNRVGIILRLGANKAQINHF